MREGDTVRIVNGKNKGKTARVIGPVPISPVQDVTHGQDITMEGAKIYWAIEFEDGTQDVLEEIELEVIEG